MIQTKYGDLLDAKGVIVHGCNAQGVFGSGVALQIKNKWPCCYESYLNLLKDHKEYCSNNPLGLIAYCKPEDDVVVANMITQLNYGRDGKRYVSYDAIRKGFRSLNVDLLTLNFFGNNTITVNFPMIGAGLGGGDFNIISKIIDEELDDSLEKILWVKE